MADPDLQYFGSAFELKTRSGSSSKLMEAWSVCIPVTADSLLLWWGTGSEKLLKMTFYIKNIIQVGKVSKTYLQRYTKSILKAGNRVYLLIFVNFHAPGSGSAFPIRIRIWDSQSIRIHNTVCNPDSRFFISISRVQYRRYLRSRPSLKALSLVSSTAILDLSTAVTLTFSWLPEHALHDSLLFWRDVPYLSRKTNK